MTTETTHEQPTTATTATPSSHALSLDAWGNTILGAPGRLGQYRIRTARNGRELRVCGEAATTAHLWAWEYDAGELRFVCAVCWGQALSAPDAE